MDISKLLQRFPNGFSVSPTGKIYEIFETFGSPEEASLANIEGGKGLILIGPPLYQKGDEKFLPKKVSEDEMRQVLKQGRPF